MADERLLQAVDALRFENAQYHDENYAKQGKIVDNTGMVAKTMGELLDEFREGRRQSALDAEEARRDSQSNAPAPSRRDGSDSTDPDNPFDLKGILQILAGIGAAVSGFAVGLVQGFGKILLMASKSFARLLKLDKLVAPIKNLAKGINTRFVNLAASVMRQIRSAILAFSISFPRLTNMLINFGTRISDIGKSAGKSFDDVIKGFKTTFSNLKMAFVQGTNGFNGLARSANGTFRSLNGIEKIANTWGKVTGQLGQSIKTIASVLGDKVVKPFQNFMRGLRGVGESTSRLGKALGTLFQGFRTIGRFIAFPVTIIMGIIDGFKGLLAGAERQEGTLNKLIGGAIGAITGVLKGLVAVPLDLLKGAVSWIAGKLGFSEFEKLLDSFSFAEAFQMIGDRIADGFIGFFDGVFYIFTDLKQRLMKPFEDGFSIEGVLTVISGLPGTIYGGILDLLKNGVSSVLRIFGANDSADTIDSFNFTDLIDGIVGSIAGFVTSTFSGLKDSLFAIFNSDSEAPLLERIYSFVRDMISTVVTFPYDLIKNVASGIFGFFGFDEAQEQLDSFSFKDTFGRMIDFIVGLPSMLVDGLMGILTGEIDVGAMISDAMATAGGMASQFNEYLKSIAQPYLADLAQDDSWLGKIGNFLVPEAAFDWAGVNPDTGAFTAIERPQVTAQTQRGSDVAEMSKENAQSAGSASVTIAAPTQSNVTNNNSNTSAIIDQNLPTVDHNDRSWSYA